MSAVPAARRMSPPQVIGGLLFRPTSTMWKVRDEGPQWLSLLSAAVLGGLGLRHALQLLMVDHLDHSVWLYWLGGIALLAAEFLGTMLLVHIAAVVAWDYRAKANDQGPPIPAGLRTLLRLGGYWYLPSSLLSLTLSGVILFAIRSGSAVALRAAMVGIVPLAVAGWIWTAIFRLRIVRTVYLMTWGQAFAIGLAVLLLGNIAAGIFRHGAPAPDAAVVAVNWDLHGALGADPSIIEALEAIPMTRAEVRVTLLPGAPQPGDLVAYYRDREAPPVRKGVGLPRPIVIGRVVGRPGSEGAAEGSTPVEVPDGYVLIRPVGTIEGLGPELIALKSIAGLVPESDLELHMWITRLLLR